LRIHGEEIISNQYQTVKYNTQIKITIKRSHFIVSVHEISNECEARDFLKKVEKQFPDATHHCWAYQYGTGKEKVSQYSDSGEPVNSAGPPILQAIKKEKVNNVIVIVSRYFGGVKLGKSGLVSAYRDAAQKALQKAGKIEKYALKEFIMENIKYNELGPLHQAIESQKGHIININYGKKVRISACLPDTYQEWITRTLKNITKGRGTIKTGRLHWYQR